MLRRCFFTASFLHPLWALPFMEFTLALSLSPTISVPLSPTLPLLPALAHHLPVLLAISPSPTISFTHYLSLAISLSIWKNIVFAIFRIPETSHALNNKVNMILLRFRVKHWGLWVWSININTAVVIILARFITEFIVKTKTIVHLIFTRNINLGTEVNPSLALNQG